MLSDPAVVSDLKAFVQPDGWVRVIPTRHAKTPLGRGFGSSRWSSQHNTFKVMYIGQGIQTAIAETVVRDRFEAEPPSRRRLSLLEIKSWSLVEIRCKIPLGVLDLTGTGALRLGLDTDAVGARSHRAGQEFSQLAHSQLPDLDGIMYSSRLTGGRCIGVYDRSIDRCLEAPPATNLIEAPELDNLLTSLNIKAYNSEKE